MSSKVDKVDNIVDIRNRMLQARDELDEAVSDLLGEDEEPTIGSLYPHGRAEQLTSEQIVTFTDILVAVDKAIEGE